MNYGRYRYNTCNDFLKTHTGYSKVVILIVVNVLYNIILG